jgi:hypothetical protein
VNLSQITKALNVDRLVLQLQDMVARINTIWGKEHYGDGRHKMPQWRDRAYNPQDYSSASGLAVAATGVLNAKYWKHGDCLMMNVAFTGTLAGADSYLSVLLPDGFLSLDYSLGFADIYDGGVPTTGIIYAQAQVPYLVVARTNRAAFTPGAVQVYGQVMLRTTA